jgi:hypothetical protein
MFDFRQVGRLLRQDWESPTDLARELYGLFTNRDARTIAQPISIEVPKGQSGISISREKPPESPGNRPNATTTTRPNRATVPKAERPDLIRSDLAPSRSISDAPDLNFPRPPESMDPGGVSPEAPRIEAAPGNWPSSPVNRPPASNRQNRSSQVQSGPDFSPVRPDAGGPTGSKAYSKPVFEASGEIRFSGLNPVQFDAPPRIFNPKTDEYEPYDFDGSLTRIPLDDNGGDVFWGQVVSGKGATYTMDIYTDPDPETQPLDRVSVSVVGLDSKETVPPKTWVYPVVPNADGTRWYALVPMWI